MAVRAEVIETSELMLGPNWRNGYQSVELLVSSRTIMPGERMKSNAESVMGFRDQLKQHEGFRNQQLERVSTPLSKLDLKSVPYLPITTHASSEVATCQSPDTKWVLRNKEPRLCNVQRTTYRNRQDYLPR